MLYYCILLFLFVSYIVSGSIVILLLFTSLSSQTTSVKVPNPSLSVCKRLQDLYPDTLKCPCSNVMVPYNTFISLSATLHQVCSSDYVTESWISLLLLLEANPDGTASWYGVGSRHFHLLSTLCQLANETIADAINRFGIQSVVSSNVLTELDFKAQLNTTLNQFLQSMIIDFSHLVDTVQLFTQVDQPYTRFDNALLIRGNIINESNEQSLQVFFQPTDKSTLFGIC